MGKVAFLHNHHIVNVDGCKVVNIMQDTVDNAHAYIQGSSGQYRYLFQDKGKATSFSVVGGIGSHVHNTGTCAIKVYGDKATWGKGGLVLTIPAKSDYIMTDEAKYVKAKLVMLI